MDSEMAGVRTKSFDQTCIQQIDLEIVVAGPAGGSVVEAQAA